MLNPSPGSVSKLVTVLACLLGLLSAGCASPVEPQANQAAVQSIDPEGRYCQAVVALLIAQPSRAFEDEELSASMDFYADSVERLADLSSPDDAEVLLELAATARLVGADPDDREQAQRLGNMFNPVAAITLRAQQVCGIGD